MKSNNMLELGLVVFLIGTGLGTYLIHKGNRTSSNNRIQVLEDSLAIKNKELKTKTDEIKVITDEIKIIADIIDENTTEIGNISKNLVDIGTNTGNTANKILDISKELDINTKKIEDISKEIENVSIETNSLASIIKNEQKEKGVIKLSVPNYRRFNLLIGGNIISYSRQDLEKGFAVSMNGINFPVYMQIVNNELLITAVLKDIEGNLIIEMKEGEWALSKSRNFSINYDQHALEIIDKKGLINFQIELRDNNISFIGTIYESKRVIISTPQALTGLSYEGDFLKEIFDLTLRIPPIFKHHGDSYLGKRFVYDRN